MSDAGPSIRVILADVAPLLRGILEGLLGAEPDFQVRVLNHESAPIEAEIEQFEPHVVVLGDRNRWGAEGILGLLEARPRTRVVVLEGDGSEASLYALTPDRSKLGNVSREVLVSAIRAAAAEKEWKL